MDTTGPEPSTKPGSSGAAGADGAAETASCSPPTGHGMTRSPELHWRPLVYRRHPTMEPQGQAQGLSHICPLASAGTAAALTKQASLLSTLPF